MKIHNLKQGTRRWHNHRKKYRNASDSPVVMGVSPYKTRGQYLKERVLDLYMPIANDYILQMGHKWEALARPIMEQLVGEKLFQVVATRGPWSASLDGFTLLGEVVTEHKMLNDSIRAASTIEELPIHYKVQMEHQLLVTESRTNLFCATQWEGDFMTDCKHFWYEPNLLLRGKLIQAWEEFEAEVRFYRSVLDNIPVGYLEHSETAP